MRNMFVYFIVSLPVSVTLLSNLSSSVVLAVTGQPTKKSNMHPNDPKLPRHHLCVPKYKC